MLVRMGSGTHLVQRRHPGGEERACAGRILVQCGGFSFFAGGPLGKLREALVYNTWIELTFTRPSRRCCGMPGTFWPTACPPGC